MDPESTVQEDLHNIVRNCQSHQHMATCYKYWKGPPGVKECHFNLGDHQQQPCTYFDQETGEIHLHCLDGLVNNFNRTIIQAIRCNMDIKFIGSGPSTKAVIYYITDYITKSQLKTHVTFAALELAVRKLNEIDSEDDPVTTRAKQLLQKCAYVMVSHQELSAQQVCSYLMDFEEHFTSHEYCSVFWRSFEIYIDCLLPLKSRNTTDSDVDCDLTDHFENEEDAENKIDVQDEVGIATNMSGEIVLKMGKCWTT